MVRITLRNRPTASLRAFTLIELLAVTAIIVIISSIILVNNNRFGGVVQLENLAYDVALSVRQAQVYGISVQRFGDASVDCSLSGSHCFERAYGMHFDTSTDASKISYMLFADVDQDGHFTAGEDVPPSPYTIRSGFKIYHLCSPEGDTASGCHVVTKLDIMFRRPEADAWISAGDDSCAYGQGVCATSARIVLISPRNDTVSVTVGINGQISVSRDSQ